MPVKHSYQIGLEHIEKYWDKLIITQTDDTSETIGLPHPFVSPSTAQFRCDQFYWDSYFINLGLIRQDRLELAKGMIDNLITLHQRFGLIPMRNRFYDTGISQPPFLTSMVRDVYERTGDKKWLKQLVEMAESELAGYWMNGDQEDHIIDHLCHRGLSRYADHHLIDQTAEHESGWDMTSRFDNHALAHLPVDLNSLLYKYEIDLADCWEELGDHDKAAKFRSAARARQSTMNELFWDNGHEFFFDYNYQNGAKHHFFSLAGYFPLWAGWASEKQAKILVDKLEIFEYSGGLATTQSDNLIVPFRQWDYPNGWAPLHYLVCVGLKNYGYETEAKRIARKWLDLNLRVFEETGNFWEKYDVVNEDIGKEGRYPIQRGFGWTNGVFVALSEWYKP